MTAKRREPSHFKAIREAAAKLGPDVEVEVVSATKCYLTSPVGKVWAADLGCHVMMPVINFPDDLAPWLRVIACGLADCPVADCEFCGRFVAAEKAEALRVGLDSARL